MIPPDVDKHRVVVPDHVVYRQFANEMVVLNLETGQYHGLNPTAGRMLEVLTEQGSVGSAVELLASEFAQDPGRISTDVNGLLDQLVERDVVRLEASASAPR